MLIKDLISRSRYLLKHPGDSLINLGDDQARAYIQR